MPLENLTFDLFTATPAQAPEPQPIEAGRELASITSLLERAEAKLRDLDETHPHPDNAHMLRRLNDLLDELQERAAAPH